MLANIVLPEYFLSKVFGLNGRKFAYLAGDEVDNFDNRVNSICHGLVSNSNAPFQPAIDFKNTVGKRKSKFPAVIVQT